MGSQVLRGGLGLGVVPGTGCPAPHQRVPHLQVVCMIRVCGPTYWLGRQVVGSVALACMLLLPSIWHGSFKMHYWQQKWLRLPWGSLLAFAVGLTD